MSSIWTRCAGDSEIRRLSVDAVRAVEAQHQVSTRKLVDRDAEQAVLEDLIDTAKPPHPGDAATAARSGLHYLLSTPFRYPPLPRGSRFGARHERGVWYGSETVETAFAEVAYYRFVFLAGTAAQLTPLTTDLTTFVASVRTRAGLHLTDPPFDAFRSDLAAPDRYDASQAVGSAMREAGVAAFRSFSARDPLGINVSVLDPSAFGRRTPKRFQAWLCTALDDRVEMTGRGWFDRESWSFPRDAFLIDGRLPVAAV